MGNIFIISTPLPQGNENAATVFIPSRRMSLKSGGGRFEPGSSDWADDVVSRDVYLHAIRELAANKVLDQRLPENGAN